MLTTDEITQLAHQCNFVLHESAGGRLILQPALLRFAREVERATAEKMMGMVAAEPPEDEGPMVA